MPHVPLPDALAHPRTVMIKLGDAHVAVGAVGCLRRLENLALVAVSPRAVLGVVCDYFRRLEEEEEDG